MERDFEAEASADGWVPEAQWDKPDKEWVDARTFIEKGEKVMGIVKGHRDRLKVENTELLSRIETLEMTTKEYGEYQRQLRDSDRSKAQEEVKSLKLQLAEAVSSADGPEFTRLNEEIASREKSIDVRPGPDNRQIAQKWHSENEWYGKDSILTDYADGVANRLQRQGVTGKFYFEEITRQVKAAFPGEFKNTNRERENGVESGGNREVPNRKAQSYDNLPAWAKEACDKFDKTGVCSKKDYVANFEW